LEIWRNKNQNDLSEEIWKNIEDFPDYQVSNYGRVKSLKNYRQWKPGRILNQEIKSGGYLQVALYKNKKEIWKSVHRLVLENFNPIKNMDNLECNHKNGIKPDNLLENLEWVNRSENMIHAYKKGLKKVEHSYETKLKISKARVGKYCGCNAPFFNKHHSINHKIKMSEKMKGENNPNSKIKKDIIIEIEKLSGILSQKKIGKLFGISQSQISKIITKKEWRT
jgi:predicted XRE-type DNA-binding protein